MSVYVDIRRALVTATKKALSTEFVNPYIVISHAGTEEAPETYGVVNILSIFQTGKSVVSTGVNADNEMSLQAHYEVLAQFSFLGSLSNDMAFCFSHNISSNPVVYEELYKSQVAYLRKSDIRRAPQKRETEWIEACNIDVTFNVIINQQQIIDTVDAVIIQDTITGEVYTVPPDVVIP